MTHAHLAQATIPPRQRRTLSQASASSCVPKHVQPNESAMLAPPVPWQARAARGSPPPRRSIALPSRWATTTSRHRLEISSSGYGLLVRAGLLQHCALLLGSSGVGLRALHKVMSTASWAPLKHGRSCARTSMRLSSFPRTPKFMSRGKALNFNRALVSRHTRASTRSVCDDLFLMRPERVQRPWWHRAHRVVGSGICALQQDLPGTLQVWHSGDPFPQDPFFRDAFFHLLRP